MKTTKIIFSMFALFTAAVIINGCSENDLELVNPNGLSPETFFKTEAQVQSAVNAVYSNLQTRGLYSRHMFFSQDNMSHENDGNPQLEADKRQYLDFSFDSSHGPIADYWESCYRGINKANFVIGNEEAINAIEESLLSNASKQKFIGEAKFLRALFNFLLVTRFGDMPLITEIPTTTEGVAKSSADEVYALIISDLQSASATLLDKSEEANGRATKGAAIALLGKVYLFRGEHALALAEFNKLSGYALEPNFFDNFTEETEHGVESIFEIEYDDALGTSAQWNSSVTGAGPNEATFRGQEYGFNDWFNVFPSDDLLDEYEEGDTRYADTFYSVGDTFGGGVVTAEMLTAGDQRRAGWKKYQNYYKDANEDQESGINFNYLRYADVLLMKAECENEVGTQDDAIDLINEVRERASLDGLPYGLSKAAVFEAIVHERKVELAGEQVRFNDILRWNLATTELAGTNFQVGKSELWPIPDREITSNENVTAADQNPGY
ncbi:RagB/SusD family nutrient uptake outer membrane protein [Maribacter huludaoensis]|uniref:RagB/SusD family nutrient uptake outer membrane protein n=1 Tax=Maribacter huludaoensis TaxID=3030010 RepID=UPI0023EA980B|nr:RagB/SusD family nutrient uptake outer membrane protein [Maribacter huludaoensis]MDF4223034.1 RagB/SusD family nutrient uptake outer membrane protein [Maribacter huludaoensis]